MFRINNCYHFLLRDSESDILNSESQHPETLAKLKSLFLAVPNILDIHQIILDRLVHHVKVFKITGKSYRMRNKI
ncbi:ATP-binding protein [Enterococcus casseliflavus]|uniref:ATP-binding protein n=1 Tax=Enterococcus casseliflavus TaxID=37734 RepID=UPI00288CEEB2|nr:ATP-binding protein [Enterococcus casseliflavus]MDT2987754.1 ATP-binding protein [Enterococcus casseliflavus]